MNGQTRKRVNVLTLSGMICGMAVLAVVGALAGAIIIPDAGEALVTGAVGGAVGVTSALAMLGKAVLDADAPEPYDSAAAAHAERLAAIEAAKEERLAAIEAETKRQGEHERIVTALVEKVGA